MAFLWPFIAVIDPNSFVLVFRYVDAYRMISVNCDSGNDDLKSIMAKAGSKVRSADAKEIPGEPNLVMYLKLAEHLLRKGHFDVDWVALSKNLMIPTLKS